MRATLDYCVAHKTALQVAFSVFVVVEVILAIAKVALQGTVSGRLDIWLIVVVRIRTLSIRWKIFS